MYLYIYVVCVYLKTAILTHLNVFGKNPGCRRVVLNISIALQQQRHSGMFRSRSQPFGVVGARREKSWKKKKFRLLTMQASDSNVE